MLQPEEIKFIQEHLQQDASRIALSAKKYPQLDIKKLASQIQARQKLGEKIPFWTANESIFFPQQISLEQASSEATAKFKASLVGGKLIDITGGMGIDAWAFSQTCEEVTYVEQQEELAQQTRYNHGVLGLSNVNHQQGDGLTHLNQSYDWIYVDPARRDEQGNKVILFKDCQPNVLDILSYSKTSKLLIKTSPVLDIYRAIQELGGVEKVYVIAFQNEVKELLFIKSSESSLDPLIEIVELANSSPSLYRGTLYAEKNAEMHLDKVGKYVYEAHPAVLKAGFFKLVQKENLWQLGLHTHLYSSNELFNDFPGKRFECISSGPVQRDWLLSHLSDLRVNISTKNFPLKADALRKKLKLKDGGEFTLYAIQNREEKNELLLCKKCT
jgi:16S rRNA G966 N2-methylase RsmD